VAPVSGPDPGPASGEGEGPATEGPATEGSGTEAARPDRDAVAMALARIRAEIAEACRSAGRDPGGVLLIAVTKTVPMALVRAAREAGIDDLGENYANELRRKASRIEATWHFIGRLQHGSAATVAELAAVVHSAEPGGGLRKLARRAAESGRRVPCLAQVDFTGRRQGVAPEELPGFLEDLENLEGVRLVGLMTLPPQTPRPEGARPYFARLRELRDAVRPAHPGLVELSMGMSADYRIAVGEGATMVRVGTALFGRRPAERSRASGSRTPSG
jgi:PLP dependent protein